MTLAAHALSNRPIGGDKSVASLDERSRYLRRLVIRALQGGGRGHVGSSLSPLEMIRVLYDDVLRYRPDDAHWPGRDLFVMSKGHGCLALYALLADKNFIPIETLDDFCRFESILGGHPEFGKVPGVEASTGALGHGLSIGVGMALAARIQRRDTRIFVLCGDGEINEGSVWEAAMAASKHNLSNLTVLIDYNKLQSAGPTDAIQPLEPLADKFRAFGFRAVEVDGHDLVALRQMLVPRPEAGVPPLALICHTIKGRGIGFAEGRADWHHKAKLPQADIDRLIAGLGEAL